MINNHCHGVMWNAQQHTLKDWKDKISYAGPNMVACSRQRALSITCHMYRGTPQECKVILVVLQNLVVNY